MGKVDKCECCNDKLKQCTYCGKIGCPECERWLEDIEGDLFCQECAIKLIEEDYYE